MGISGICFLSTASQVPPTNHPAFFTPLPTRNSHDSPFAGPEIAHDGPSFNVTSTCIEVECRVLVKIAPPSTQ